MITREQLEARIACDRSGETDCIADCDLLCATSTAVARQMLTLMDDNQRLTERNTALEVVIRQAHYKLQHHSATYEAMRILGAAPDALCAAPTTPKEEQ